MGNAIFMDCISLKNVKINGNITDIKTMTFYNCTNL